MEINPEPQWVFYATVKVTSLAIIKQYGNISTKEYFIHVYI